MDGDGQTCTANPLSPVPFVLDVSVLKDGQPFHTAAGRLDDQCDHPLRGLWIILSKRHAVSDSNHNLKASDVEHDRMKPAHFAFLGFAAARLK